LFFHLHPLVCFGIIFVKKYSLNFTDFTLIELLDG